MTKETILLLLLQFLLFEFLITNPSSVSATFTKWTQAFKNNNSSSEYNSDCNPKTSDLVIVGKVSNVTRVKYIGIPIVREHDPKWMQAIVQIESIEKGTFASGNRAVVLFPSSNDVAWKDSPRLFIEEEGIFILHKGPIPQLNGEEYHTVICPSDVQTKDKVQQIMKLIG